MPFISDFNDVKDEYCAIYSRINVIKWHIKEEKLWILLLL